MSQSTVSTAKSMTEAEAYRSPKASRLGHESDLAAESRTRSRQQRIFAGCLIAVLLVTIYYRIGVKLVTDWLVEPLLLS